MHDRRLAKFFFDKLVPMMRPIGMGKEQAEQWAEAIRAKGYPVKSINDWAHEGMIGMDRAIGKDSVVLSTFKNGKIVKSSLVNGNGIYIYPGQIIVERGNTWNIKHWKNEDSPAQP